MEHQVVINIFVLFMSKGSVEMHFILTQRQNYYILLQLFIPQVWIFCGQAGQPGPDVPRPAKEECSRPGPAPALGPAAGARLVPALHKLMPNAVVS